MKKILIAAGMIFYMASPALAGDVKVSGAVELQYRMSSDAYETQGDDKFKAEELYIQIEKDLEDNVSAMIKLDASDMENNATSDRFVEEAQVIFRNVANVPLTIAVGKDEMPWIQDYEKFLFSSWVHDMEVDKVLGVHGQYKIDGFGSFDLAFYEREAKGSTYNTGLADSMTVMLNADKLVDNLSVSLGYAKEGKDEGAENDDATGTSIAARYKWNDLTLHAELVNTAAHDGTSEMSLTQVGADYKIDKLLFKARYETKDPDKGAGDNDTLSALGVSYYFSNDASLSLEHQTETPDGGDAVNETLVGFAFKY